MEVTEGTCCHCGNTNKERVGFKLWVFKYHVCQSCISKAFRSFTKGK